MITKILDFGHVEHSLSQLAETAWNGQEVPDLIYADNSDFKDREIPALEQKLDEARELYINLHDKLKEAVELLKLIKQFETEGVQI